MSAKRTVGRTRRKADQDQHVYKVRKCIWGLLRCHHSLPASAFNSTMTPSILRRARGSVDVDSNKLLPQRMSEYTLKTSGQFLRFPLPPP